MHIPDIAQILLPSALRADTLLPSVYQFQNSRHNRTRERRRSFGETSNQLVEEFLGGYLEMKGVSTCLDEGVQEGEGEDGDVWVAMVG